MLSLQAQYGVTDGISNEIRQLGGCHRRVGRAHTGSDHAHPRGALLGGDAQPKKELARDTSGTSARSPRWRRSPGRTRRRWTSPRTRTGAATATRSSLDRAAQERRLECVPMTCAQRQRGASLIIVLVVLAVMLVGSLAMLRSSEVSGLVAGNVSFKEAAPGPPTSASARPAKAAGRHGQPPPQTPTSPTRTSPRAKRRDSDGLPTAPSTGRLCPPRPWAITASST